jgi:hypothetical protein
VTARVGVPCWTTARVEAQTSFLAPAPPPAKLSPFVVPTAASTAPPSVSEVIVAAEVAVTVYDYD